MRIEIGMDETEVTEPVKCRNCEEMVEGKVWRVYYIIGEVEEVVYTKYYICEKCQWENDKDSSK